MLYVCGIDIRDLFEQCARQEQYGQKNGKNGKGIKDDASMSFLSEKRLAQIRQLKQEKDKERCAAAGLLEFYGVRKFCDGQTPPTTNVGDDGKPYFTEFPDLYYNLSHAGDYVVAAFSDAPVGIDVADQRPCKDSLLRRCLTESERKWLNRQRNVEEAFCRLWAAKESYVKWKGCGLRKDFRQVEISLEGLPMAQELNAVERRIDETDTWNTAYLREWRELDRYVISVCCGNQKQLKEIQSIHWITKQELEEMKQ